MPRPERIFRTDAIILRRQDFGEADRLLTVFTPYHGKLKAIAKGSRKPAGRTTGHVELYTRVKMMISYGRELHVVSQAELSEPYLALREDLERGAYANYVVELLDHFSEIEEVNTSLYDLLDVTLARLCEPKVDLRLLVRFYELKALELVGFQPALFNCAIGQEKIEAQDQFFSVQEGGVVCPLHAKSGKFISPMSLTTLKTLRYLQTRDYDVIKVLRVDDVLHLELERTLQNYIVHVLERRLKSIDFIRRLRRLGQANYVGQEPTDTAEFEEKR
jgi:DNA repair protein RecO (recombination protein O)